MFTIRAGRIEISIESLANQTATIGEQVFRFAAGELIQTEYSHKYSTAGFTELAQRAGLQTEEIWKDEQDYFALMLLRVA